MFQGMNKAANQILDQVVELCWWMRGSLQYETAFTLTPIERQKISTYVKDRIERMEKDKMMPIY